MHLRNSDAHRVEMTITALKKQGIDLVVPLHCTGMRAIAAMREELGSACILPEVGRVIQVYGG